MTTNQAFTILSNAGGVRAARIITENNGKLSWFSVWKMSKMLRRGVPVAKIIKQKWFYGLCFQTNKHTLDPRPDTETLVSAVIADCGTGCTPNILDLGTGTACIIVSLIKNIHGARGVALDLSRKALRVARQNIKTYNLGQRIQIRRASFAHKIKFDKKFDIIVSNPPYIAHNDTRIDMGAMHDPKMALYADNNGLAAYESIAQNAQNWIKRGGKLYLEIGIDMGTNVRQIFESNKWKFVRAERDLGGIERVLVFTK